MRYFVSLPFARGILFRVRPALQVWAAELSFTPEVLYRSQLKRLPVVGVSRGDAPDADFKTFFTGTKLALWWLPEAVSDYAERNHRSQYLAMWHVELPKVARRRR